METSAQLYADMGYSAVSMRDVATKAGVAPANLYHHFKGKNDLVREAVAHVFARETAPLAELLESKSDDGERLELFVEFFLRLLTEDRVFFAWWCASWSMATKNGCPKNRNPPSADYFYIASNIIAS